jgi:hypothetical protein
MLKAAVSVTGESGPLSAEPVSGQLLSQDPAQGLFEILFARFRKAAQSIIDESLIAAASGLVNLPPEPLKDVVVDPNRDSRFARPNGNNSAAPTMPN